MSFELDGFLKKLSMSDYMGLDAVDYSPLSNCRGPVTEFAFFFHPLQLSCTAPPIL